MTMWKKLLTAAALTTAFASVPAHAAFLTNWYFQPDGTATTQTQINEYFDLVGPSFVSTTVPNGAGNFTFNEWGAVMATGHDGGAPGYNSFSGQVASLFTTNGSATLGGSILYQGGTINIWSNSSVTFGGTTGIYGVNPLGATLIGTFTPVSGNGLLQPTGIPNGQQTIQAAATFLAPGYWIAPNGSTDLSTLVPSGLLFGFATTNASVVGQPSTNQLSEIVTQFASGTYTGCLPGQAAPCDGTGNFIISNNGQYRLSVPEPGSLALFGLSVFLLGAFARRRVS
jgi:hypothetical protein